MKYIIWGIVAFLVYRYMSRKSRPLDKGPQREPLQNEAPRKKATQEEEDYIDYEEVE